MREKNDSDNSFGTDVILKATVLFYFFLFSNVYYFIKIGAQH